MPTLFKMLTPNTLSLWDEEYQLVRWIVVFMNVRGSYVTQISTFELVHITTNNGWCLPTQLYDMKWPLIYSTILALFSEFCVRRILLT